MEHVVDSSDHKKRCVDKALPFVWAARRACEFRRRFGCNRKIYNRRRQIRNRFKRSAQIWVYVDYPFGLVYAVANGRAAIFGAVAQRTSCAHAQYRTAGRASQKRSGKKLKTESAYCVSLGFIFVPCTCHRRLVVWKRCPVSIACLSSKETWWVICKEYFLVLITATIFRCNGLWFIFNIGDLSSAGLIDNGEDSAKKSATKRPRKAADDVDVGTDSDGSSSKPLEKRPSIRDNPKISTITNRQRVSKTKKTVKKKKAVSKKKWRSALCYMIQLWLQLAVPPHLYLYVQYLFLRVTIENYETNTNCNIKAEILKSLIENVWYAWWQSNEARKKVFPMIIGEPLYTTSSCHCAISHYTHHRPLLHNHDVLFWIIIRPR